MTILGGARIDEPRAAAMACATTTSPRPSQARSSTRTGSTAGHVDAARRLPASGDAGSALAVDAHRGRPDGRPLPRGHGCRRLSDVRPAARPHLAQRGSPRRARHRGWGRAVVGCSAPAWPTTTSSGYVASRRLLPSRSAAQPSRHQAKRGHEGGDLLGRRVTAHDAQRTLVRRRRRHSGMFPCLRRQRFPRLVRSARSARTIWPRVCDGSITASTYPRSAAM